MVIGAACRHLGMDVALNGTPERDRYSVYLRRLVAVYLRESVGLTHSAIAAELGKKDHSTIIHLIKVPRDSGFRADLHAITTRLAR